MAPLIVREDPALQNCLARLDALAGGCEAEPVQAAEGIEIRGREGSVGHVEVFQMASVRTSIIGRPRRLSPHRRAHPATDRYTLICEEPVKAADLTENCDPDRAFRRTSSARYRLSAKYAESWAMLMGVTS